VEPAVTPPLDVAAPDFTLPDQHGQRVSLADFRGDRPVVVVFYPFAFSGLCTGELGEIRDAPDVFASEKVQVVAVSCDPVHSLRAFTDAEGYHFPLLSDFWPHGEVSARYGVFDETRGRPGRGSFLVDTSGVLRWSIVNSPGEARPLSAYREAIAAL
jgi:peroxiredoxin (alkyl hydroperoxide reductase subunit C)